MSHDAHCEYFRQLVIVLSMKKVNRWKSFEKKCICRDVFQAINVKSSREILLLMVVALGLVGGETKVFYSIHLFAISRSCKRQHFKTKVCTAILK